MAGVDKIVEKIMSKAEAQAQEILAEAKTRADGITADYKAAAAADVEKAAARSKASVESYGSKVQSTIDLNRRQAFLMAKQEIISEMLEKAYQKLAAAPDAEYFEMLLTILKQNVQPQDGMIALSAKDQERMPADFEQKAGAIAQAAGGNLKLSGQTAKIENGFVLVYGDIEENCSLQAIFDARKEELVDLVHGILS